MLFLGSRKLFKNCVLFILSLDQVQVFWVMALCSVVVGYQHVGGPYYLQVHHLLGKFISIKYFCKRNNQNYGSCRSAS
jgi:hypothetical protein